MFPSYSSTNTEAGGGKMKLSVLLRWVPWVFLPWFTGLIGCSSITPRTPVDNFYKVYLKMKPVGLPTKEQEQKMAPYLSKRLLELMDEARNYQEEFRRQSPEDIPPWVDGCLFASLFEGPDRFEIVDLVPNPDETWTVKVHFGYVTYEWEDLVIIGTEGQRYVIVEILMSGAGDFNPPGRLSGNLKYRGE